MTNATSTPPAKKFIYQGRIMNFTSNSLDPTTIIVPLWGILPIRLMNIIDEHQAGYASCEIIEGQLTTTEEWASWSNLPSEIIDEIDLKLNEIIIR